MHKLASTSVFTMSIVRFWHWVYNNKYTWNKKKTIFFFKVISLDCNTHLLNKTVTAGHPEKLNLIQQLHSSWGPCHHAIFFIWGQFSLKKKNRKSQLVKDQMNKEGDYSPSCHNLPQQNKTIRSPMKMVWNKLCACLLFQILLENLTNHLHVNEQLIHHNLRNTDIMANILAHLLLQYHSQPVLNTGQIHCLDPVFTSMYCTVFELVFQLKDSMAHARTNWF